MKLRHRIKLAGGILVVLLLVSGLFLYLNYSMSNISSRSATIESDGYAVSIEYGGTISEQFIEVGDRVKTGDPLFEIQSSTLSDALDSDSATVRNLPFSVTDDGNAVVRASNDGIIREVNFLNGAFVPANTQMAAVDIDNAKYVTARFLLNAPDYARIVREEPVTVTLPDNTHLEAEIFDITLEKNGENVYTIVKARFDQSANIPTTFASGTPVQTRWQLEQNVWYRSSLEFLQRLFEPTTGM